MWVDSQQGSNGATDGQNSSLSLGSVADISLKYKDAVNSIFYRF